MHELSVAISLAETLINYMKEHAVKVTAAIVEAPVDLPYPDQAYTLTITQQGIDIQGYGENGLLYAVITLEQLNHWDIYGCRLPAMRITDWTESLCRGIRPDCIIAVDALASRSLERLCRTVQLSDTGITPGSGVGNHRAALTRQTLGIPVIAIGVPTVVDGATLALDVLARAGVESVEPETLGGQGRDLFVTPREIDVRVATLAKVIGYGINLALQPRLTLSDLELLLE